MTTIRYRVWDDLHKSGMCEVLSIDFLNNEFGYVCNCGGVHWLYKNDFSELLAWTGWKDIKGKMIFEGDYVKLNNLPIGGSDGIAEVIWCNDFTLKNNPGWGLWFPQIAENGMKGGYNDLETFLGCEVIGNQYEKPACLLLPSS